MDTDKQQLKARFFGAHIGCKVDIAGEEKRIMLGIHNDNSRNAYEVVCKGRHPLMAVCKLILRPLSDITDSEAVELAETAIGDKIDSAKATVKRGVPIAGKTPIRVDLNDNDSAIYYVVINYDYTLKLKGELSSRDCTYEFEFEHVTDYLRSKNFALPFMGHDPIAKGWAILETPNETTP